MAARKLSRNVWVGGEYFAAGSTPPADVAEQITNPNAWGGDAQGEESGGYTGMKKGDLEAEVARRNAEREDDDQIVVGGNGTVKDLIAALEADDADNE